MSDPREKGGAGSIGKAFQEQLTRSAADVVSRVATILKTATTHDPNNAAWKVHINALAGSIGPLLRSEKAAVLELRDGQFTLNKSLVRSGYADFAAVKYLAGELAKVACGGIEFRGLPEELEIKKFAYTFNRQAAAEAPSFQTLEKELQAAGVRKILLIPEELGLPQAMFHKDPRVYGVYTFLKGIAAVHEVMEGLRTGKSVGFKRAKRFVQAAVDLLSVDPGLLLALTTIKNYDDYLYNHSVNVSLISLVVGSRLGFTKQQLGDLGLAALLRDVGKALVPKEVLEKKGQLTPEEWALMQSFPFAAVQGLLRFRGFNEGALRQVIVAFEHKFKSTKDERLSSRDFNLYSRIAQLADAFDAMTTPRPYRPKPMPPNEALKQIIMDRHVTRAEPSLIKAFFHAMGIFPVGTVVVLDTNEIAVVAAPPAHVTALPRPRVRLISDAQGHEIPNAPIVDLMDYDEFADPPRYVRSIASVVDRWKFGINVSRHLLSDEAAPEIPGGLLETF